MKISINSSNISACPADLNVLPEFGRDPRTIDKLVDGTYITSDEIHSWLAPRYEGKVNKIRIILEKETKVSMIRIWNYNKSRIHSSRGVKEMSIKLNKKLIFFGIITQASGEISTAADHSEHLIFCPDYLYEMVQENDWLLQNEGSNKDEITNIERPTTSNGESQFVSNINPDITDIRKQIEINRKKLEKIELEGKEKAKKISENKKLNPSFIECQKLSIKILENWGDPNWVGLTGIEFYNERNMPIELSTKDINASPKDYYSEKGKHSEMSLENLINGMNLTTSSS